MGSAVLDALLEQRLKAIEQRLDALGTTTSSDRRAGGTPPKPTNLSSSKQPGIIAFEWDASPAADLLNYRVEIADNESFLDSTEFTTVDPRFVFYQGVAGTTYYCRVAARNRSERSSGFTAPVSSQIGTTIGDSDDEEATQNIYCDFVESFYNSQSIPSGTNSFVKINSTTDMSLSVTIPDTGTWALFVIGAALVEGDNADKGAMFTAIFEDGAEVGVRGGSTHADLATGRDFGGVAFRMVLSPTLGKTYLYNLRVWSNGSTPELTNAGLYSFLFRTF